MFDRKSLLGIHQELDKAVKDLAFLGSRYQAFHPAAGGDVSQLFTKEASRVLARKFRRRATKWFDMSSIQDMDGIRGDGRIGYRSQGVINPRYYEHTKCLDGRVMLITCTGSQLAQIVETLRDGEDGQYLNLVEVGKDGRAIRLLYGNRVRHDSFESQLHLHLLACGIGIQSGLERAALVHAHPYHLNLLGMHPKIQGDFNALNAIAYTQVEGLNRNAPDLIGVIPYHPSGSAALVDANLDPFPKHPLMLWLNHGFVARSFSINRAYALVAYAEQAAEVGLDVLRYGGFGLPLDHVKAVLRTPELLAAYDRLELKYSAGHL